VGGSFDRSWVRPMRVYSDVITTAIEHRCSIALLVLLLLRLKPRHKERATRRRLNLLNCCKLFENFDLVDIPVRRRGPTLTSFTIEHDERPVASNFRGEAGAGLDLFTFWVTLCQPHPMAQLWQNLHRFECWVRAKDFGVAHGHRRYFYHNRVNG
jgi:hypothetical protein